MAKRALITGHHGSGRSYLAEFLLEKGYEVFGMDPALQHGVGGPDSHLLSRIEFIQTGDLLDQNSLTTRSGGPAPGGLQSGGHELRAHELEPAGADRGVHRAPA